MNFRELKSHEDEAIGIVASVINKAHEKIEGHQNLFVLRKTREQLTSPVLLSLASLKIPLAYTSEKLIKTAIEKTWKLTKCLKYHLKYRGGSHDECNHFYYFEAIFSQPSAAFPVPQATCSVFFRIEDRNIEPPERKGVPTMLYRIEGHHTDYDARYTRLIPDWILAVIQMKIIFFRRLEDLCMF